MIQAHDYPQNTDDCKGPGYPLCPNVEQHIAVHIVVKRPYLRSDARGAGCFLVQTYGAQYVTGEKFISF